MQYHHQTTPENGFFYVNSYDFITTLDLHDINSENNAVKEFIKVARGHDTDGTGSAMLIAGSILQKISRYEHGQWTQYIEEALRFCEGKIDELAFEPPMLSNWIKEYAKARITLQEKEILSNIVVDAAQSLTPLEYISIEVVSKGPLKNSTLFHGLAF